MNRTKNTTENSISDIIRNLPEQRNSENDSSIEHFIKTYYAFIGEEDLSAYSAKHLANSAVEHYQSALDREVGEHAIRVFNPTEKKNGWSSNNTIIEIVTDNKPFLIDSVTMLLNRLNKYILLTIHPILSVERNKENKVVSMIDADTCDNDLPQESFMRFEISQQNSKDSLKEIKDEIQKVLTYINVVTSDWKQLLSFNDNLLSYLKTSNLPFSNSTIEESIEFCKWTANNHFTFLGACEYEFANDKLDYVKGSGLGLLRDDHQKAFASHDEILPVSSSAYVPNAELISITKANDRSLIHRPAYMDFITINRYNDEGKIIGQSCLLGLFTSRAYNIKTLDIPLLRLKLENTLANSKLPAKNHKYNKLINIFDTYPRDSMFAIDEKDLLDISLGILALQERQKTKIFIRHDKYDRFYSCLIFVPRDKYNKELRLKMQNILMDAFHGESCEFHTHFSESVLARIHLVIRKQPGVESTLSHEEIEQSIREVSQTWKDSLRESLFEKHEHQEASEFFSKYKDAFGAGYRNDFKAYSCSNDIRMMESVNDDNPFKVRVYLQGGSPSDKLRMKLYSLNNSISPSDSLPIVENMGLKVLAEKPYRTETPDGKVIWIHDFNMQSLQEKDLAIEQSGSLFEDAFSNIWSGNAENDKFNRLVIEAGLNWKLIAMLRAYSRYSKQIGLRYSEDYITNCLIKNSSMTKELANYFSTKFDPSTSESDRSISLPTISSNIVSILNEVENLDDDKILKSFVNLIDSTLRTNFYQNHDNGDIKNYISFKFDPSKIDNLPLPRPMFEIFVCSPRVEAVHLRGGKVARGGLRWSDRLEDFRTEVLGLVKAQLVKNAVIVPTGSKGGFVVKQPPTTGDRNDFINEGIACYKIFINGMLDVTDNLLKGEVIPPQNVVRYDEDDPYLVVAADKGTATFSDISNGVADERGFWLSDAFASGGSVGYDHKGMGITARGAWESVKRNFRELGVNTQAESFSVVGVGDMGGDVFGNGMLLSEHIKLVGAFNHLHILVDPDPDTFASHAERKRLFEMPRSSWQDYNQKLISKGGGIFERSMKSVPISPEMKKLLDIEDDALTPTQLINAMLKAPVDLIWNGGIGTYVKATSETHEDASDKANDVLRVNGNELRCKVIGEGGNLGMTQLGRIEFCQNGGKCYTDFIDNSAGVDTSDHEVNIKILLNDVSEQGKLTYEERNDLLAQMTDEVADLVLIHNYQQTQAISIELSDAHRKANEYIRFITKLEDNNILNRELEFLPSNEEILARAENGQGLTAPEISILLAYSKIEIYDKLLETDIPDDPYIRNVVEKYFPSYLVENYRAEIVNHKLRREIVATYISNKMINQLGPLSAFHLNEITGANIADITRAYACACDIFETDKTWAAVEALDNNASAETQISLLDDTAGMIDRATLWLLRNRRSPMNIQDTIDTFSKGVHDLRKNIISTLAQPSMELHNSRKQKFVDQKVPEDLAEVVASFTALSSILDIVEVSQLTDADSTKVAQTYFELGDKLRLHWLRHNVAALKVKNQWHLLAKSSLRNNLHRLQRLLTSDIMKNAQTNADYNLEQWLVDNEQGSKRFNEVMNDLKQLNEVDFPMLSVALGELQILRQGN